MSRKATAAASRISAQYQREPRIVMTWKRLRTNIGAIIGLVILLALILAMYVGRIGPLCFIVALNDREEDRIDEVVPNGRIMVG